MKKQTKETINLLSLIIGILMIIIGLVGFAITFSAGNYFIIIFVLFLVLGAILALMGGLRKWG